MEVARILQGKHKPIYTAHVLTGDYVIVLNAAQVGVTGRKRAQKTYYRHTGYPGGLRTTTLQKLLDTHPDRAIKHAVRGMLPKNILARRMLGRLKVYAGAEHPHEAQVTGSLKRSAASMPSTKVEE
jgi:large subunit ribosomal protein L13